MRAKLEDMLVTTVGTLAAGVGLVIGVAVALLEDDEASEEEEEVQ